MSASVSGSKTVNNDLAPHLKAATLTTLLATPIETLTVVQLRQLMDAVSRVPKGGAESQTIGSLLS